MANIIHRQTIETPRCTYTIIVYDDGKESITIHPNEGFIFGRDATDLSYARDWNFDILALDLENDDLSDVIGLEDA